VIFTILAVIASFALPLFEGLLVSRKVAALGVIGQSLKLASNALAHLEKLKRGLLPKGDRCKGS
jgi:Tfp pilus assembly protein FimT